MLRTYYCASQLVLSVWSKAAPLAKFLIYSVQRGRGTAQGCTVISLV